MPNTGRRTIVFPMTQRALLAAPSSNSHRRASYKRSGAHCFSISLNSRHGGPLCYYIKLPNTPRKGLNWTNRPLCTASSVVFRLCVGQNKLPQSASVALSTANQKRQAWRAGTWLQSPGRKQLRTKSHFYKLYWNARCFLPPFRSTLIKIKINHLTKKKRNTGVGVGGGGNKPVNGLNSCADPSVHGAFFWSNNLNLTSRKLSSQTFSLLLAVCATYWY